MISFDRFKLILKTKKLQSDKIETKLDKSGGQKVEI